MHGMIAWFTRNHVAANLLMLFILGGGLYSVKERIPLEVFPEISVDMVNVNVALPGSSPEEVEEGIAIPVEESLQDVEGIKKITSVSQEGAARVSAEIDPKYDIYRVKDEIKNRVDALNTLPSSAERPVISQTLFKREVISVTIYGERTEKELRQMGEQVRDDLLRISGITSVELNSVRNYEISIEVDEQVLREYNLTLAQVASAIERNSIDVSGGSIKTQDGEIRLRSNTKAYRGEEFAQLPIRSTQDGTRLLLGEIATIRDQFDETPILARFNGQPAVIIEVYRVGEQSAIDVATKVKNYIDNRASLLPEGVSINYWRDRSKVVEARLQTLFKSAMQGCMLVIILLALFLRPSIAFWVTMGIPVSFMGGLLMMPFLGITLNVISLFAFIMVLGILVDDAIVTGENVYTKMRQGMPSEQAAIRGTQEVAIPVTFGILTTVAAFMPLAMIEGARGALFAQIPAIVIPVLLFSLIESKLVLPSHLKHVKPLAHNDGPLSRAQQWIADGFEALILRFYQPVLGLALRHRYVSLAVALSILLLVISMIMGGWTRFIFFPRIPAETAQATLTMPTGTAFEVTDYHVQTILGAAQQLQEKYRDPETGESVILDMFATTGSAGGQQGSDTSLGQVMFELEPPETRRIDISTNELVNEWRKLVGNPAGIESLNYRAEIGRGSSPVEVQLGSNDQQLLRQVADLFKDRLAQYPDLFDIEDSLTQGKTEYQLTITPQGQALGLTQSELAQQVRQAFYGYQVQRLQRGREDVKVFVRFPQDQRRDLQSLNSMMIRTSQGVEIPFSEVARISQDLAPTSITRIDRQRMISVTADADKEKVDMEAIKRDLTAFMQELKPLYPSLSMSLKGEAEEQSESFVSLMWGLVFVLFVLYTLLAIPFRSYSQPLVVMSVIPFGAIGAILGHWLLGMPLTLFSMMGMLALTGVVVNDSLVLVDYINRQRRQGLDLMTAVSSAGVARFRAVILTSLTTFAGLTPLIFETSTQAQFLIPMAVSLGFGILFATMITLLLVPVNYLLLEDSKRLGRWLWGRAEPRLESEST